VQTLHTVVLSNDVAAWKAQRHSLAIDARGGTLVTAVDGTTVDTVSDAGDSSGTVRLHRRAADAAVIHAVTVESGRGRRGLPHRLRRRRHPFTGGTLGEGGLLVAAGVPDKDLCCPIGTPAPLLRKAFELPAAPVSARLYLAAGGLPRVSLNGHAVGEAIETATPTIQARAVPQAST